MIFCEEKIQNAWDFVENRLMLGNTNLIYDKTLKTEEFPSLADINKGYPNPCGYSTGMEDSMICAGTILDACLCRFEKQKSDYAEKLAHLIVNGMIKCADSAKSEGFLPRSVSPNDGISHYVDSSRDQYTLFIFGAVRYLQSSLCRDDERDAFCKILLKFAKRAEKNVTADNNYDMLCENGESSLNTTLWGEKMQNHEAMRLPMIYISAYYASSDEKWLKLYENIVDKAIERSLPMNEYYWHYYSLQQMQASLFVCRLLDPDKNRKAKLSAIMKEVAKYSLNKAQSVVDELDKHSNYNAFAVPFAKMNSRIDERFCENAYRLCFDDEDASDYFCLQDSACAAVAYSLGCNKHSDLIYRMFELGLKKIDYNLHSRNTPVYFLQAYYRII